MDQAGSSVPPSGRRRKEQIGWHAETGAQTLHHRHAQPLLATHYLTHPAWGAEKRD
ncbi:MAG: hypothetical protein ACLPJY_08115 [Rhodomicrobium sp.]